MPSWEFRSRSLRELDHIRLHNAPATMSIPRESARAYDIYNYTTVLSFTTAVYVRVYMCYTWRWSVYETWVRGEVGRCRGLSLCDSLGSVCIGTWWMIKARKGASACVIGCVGVFTVDMYRERGRQIYGAQIVYEIVGFLFRSEWIRSTCYIYNCIYDLFFYKFPDVYFIFHVHIRRTWVYFRCIEKWNYSAALISPKNYNNCAGERAV